MVSAFGFKISAPSEWSCSTVTDIDSSSIGLKHDDRMTIRAKTIFFMSVNFWVEMSCQNTE